MKTPLSLVLGLMLLLGTASLHAENWTTTDGISYQDVVVVKVEPDAVTILHRDGGGLVPLIKLSPELRKRFNFDPDKAEAAAIARIQADAANAQALLAEIEQVRLQKYLKLQAENAKSANLSASASPEDVSAASDVAASAPSDPTHHSMSDLVDVNQRLRDDHYDPTHHSIASLAASARNLNGDPSDPTRHSRNDLFGSDPLSGR